MPPGGSRHTLLLYTYILNRLWRGLLATGIVLIALAVGLDLLPGWLPQDAFLQVESLRLWVTGAVGALVIFVAIFLVAFRKSAYVQPYRDHLRLVTPFLRLNISYRRIRQASCTEMARLFPNVKGWQRTFLRPLAGKMAIVLDLDGYPISRGALRLFLSPFFFPDRTTRLALLVPDWMEFSTELESMRGSWREALRRSAAAPR
ncbi:MAG: hypothetical protein ABSB41_13555 [Anaerolineales bacterium]|jgi:hypothetical protein